MKVTTEANTVFGGKLSDSVKDYAHLLLKSGFDVIYADYGSDRLPTYFSFHRDGYIGYVQKDDYGLSGFSFSSVHKPCRECGTGYQIYDGVSNPTVKMAEVTSKTSFPIWENSSKNRIAIRKYKNLNQYLNAPLHGSYKVIYAESYIR